MLQGMPRRISDYPDAYAGWNLISSLGSIVSVVAAWLFLHIVYSQLMEGSVASRYPWLTSEFNTDTLRALISRNYPSLEWGLSSPPKPHAFVSLPLQSLNLDPQSAVLLAKAAYSAANPEIYSEIIQRICFLLPWLVMAGDSIINALNASSSQGEVLDVFSSSAFTEWLNSHISLSDAFIQAIGAMNLAHSPEQIVAFHSYPGQLVLEYYNLLVSIRDANELEYDHLAQVVNVLDVIGHPRFDEVDNLYNTVRDNGNNLTVCIRMLERILITRGLIVEGEAPLWFE